jgi:hypothetical protein
LIAGIHNLWGESIRAQRAHDEAQKAMWDQDALIGRLEQQLREQRVDMSDILNLRWSLT